MEMPGSKIRFTSVLHMALELMTIKVRPERVPQSDDGACARRHAMRGAAARQTPRAGVRRPCIDGVLGMPPC